MSIEEYVANLVAQAPPLTDEQIRAAAFILASEPYGAVAA